MVLLLSLSFGGGGGIKYEMLRRKTKQHQKTTQKTKQNKNPRAEEKNNSKSLLPPRIVEN